MSCGGGYNNSVFILAKEKKVDDFKNTERVHYKQCHVPDLLMIACGVPESQSFPKEGPDYEHKNGSSKDTSHRRRERILSCNIEGTSKECVHVRVHAKYTSTSRTLCHSVSIRVCDTSALILAPNE